MMMPLLSRSTAAKSASALSWNAAPLASKPLAPMRSRSACSRHNTRPRPQSCGASHERLVRQSNPCRSTGSTRSPRRPRAALLPQYLRHRRRQRTACRHASLRRLRSVPRLAQQDYRAMDRTRRNALRCANDTNRRAQGPHISRGGARHRNSFTLNTNANINTRNNRRSSCAQMKPSPLNI